LEMRKKIKATPTDKAKDLIIKALEKLRAEGNDPNEVLEQSIMNNYTGVFPIKDGVGGAYKSRPRPVTRNEDFKEPEDY